MVQNGTEWIVCVLIKLKTMIVVQLTSYLRARSIVQFWCRGVHSTWSLEHAIEFLLAHVAFRCCGWRFRAKEWFWRASLQSHSYTADNLILSYQVYMRYDSIIPRQPDVYIQNDDQDDGQTLIWNMTRRPSVGKDRIQVGLAKYLPLLWSNGSA